MEISKRKKFHFKADWAWAYVLVAPTVIGLLILNIYPFIETFLTSLHKKQGLLPGKFVGLQNYQKLFSDSLIWQATWNTLLYMLLTVPLGIFIALILATLLNNKIKFRDAFRGIYFLPMVVAPAAIAMVWKWIFNAEYGILNQFLQLFNIKPINWLTTPGITMNSVAIIGIWSSVGYDLVLILSGLQSIPKSLYEACDVDGANPIQKFFNITVPQISPVLFFVAVMRTMSAIKQFDTIYLLVSRTNPAYRMTQTLMVQFYNEAFQKYNQGYASSIVFWIFIITAVITIMHFVGEHKLVNYD